uniref:thymidylate synthase n=1 Tax=viral metagenome TaxID=1070528 RepID=A0A6C0DBN8_9ZZZZ
MDKYPQSTLMVYKEERGYLNLLRDVIADGERRETRNGIVYSLFGKTMEFDLKDTFPLLTTKKVFFRGIIEELIFFLKGQTDTKILEKKNIFIWQPNTTAEFIRSRNLEYEDGDMGPMYGFNWLHFGAEYMGAQADYSGKGVNQLEKVIELLRTDPMSRRIIMTSYNPAQAEKGVLYPCHGISIQFYVSGGKYLSCSMTQRSSDIACGLPYNIASYSALVYALCKHLGLEPGRLIIHLGDVHIYDEHLEGALEQLSREPLAPPKLSIRGELETMGDITYEHFVLEQYAPHPPIKFVMKA